MSQIETDKRPGELAYMLTPFMNFSDSCLELFYFFHGNTSTTLMVDVFREDLYVCFLKDDFILYFHYMEDSNIAIAHRFKEFSTRMVFSLTI